jgi:prepilin-type processing-associated H-X9-DG protein
VTGGLHVVHVRVVDATNGRPTPVRMRFQGQDGRSFVPLGRVTSFPLVENQEVGLHVRTGGSNFAYVDGSCEILLPADPVEVELVKGPEFTPIKRLVTLGPGKMALRFRLERCANLSARGWFAGDCRCHELSPHAALLEGAAEGLAVVNLLVRQRASQFQADAASISLLEAFSGQAPCLTSPESIVVVNTFNVHPKLGSFSLLSTHRPIFPLQAGDPGFEDWTLGDYCGQCHRKKGLVLWSDPAFWSDAFNKSVAPEGLAQLLTGHVDAVEVAGPLRDLGNDLWSNWYALLSAGFKIPLAGGSAKVSNAQLLGQARTYAFLGPDAEFAYSAWIEAVRAGKTCVSDGPLIDFEVDGNLPGATIELAGPDQRLQVKVAVQALGGGGILELLGDGEVIASAAHGESTSASFAVEVPAGSLHWLAARYRLPSGSFAAHTSPLYMSNPSVRPAAMTNQLRMMQESLKRGARWAESEAVFRQERNREGLVSIFRRAADEIDRHCRTGVKA